MDHSQPLDSQNLFAQAAWVHRLAHSLVADPNAADDLAQDTWLTVLQSPPRDGASPRGWLATVLENLRRQERRGEARRRTREQTAARTEAQPDTLDVLARAAMHRELVEAVMSLREPFRTTILLRFFDEKPPRDIARELGVPVHTVNSRLQRGLAELRAKLDQPRGGDRSAWIVALAPLARRGAASASWASPSAIGALVMNTKWKIAALLVLALAGVLGIRNALENDREPAPLTSNVVVSALTPDRAATPPDLRLSTEEPSAARASAAIEPERATAAQPTPAPRLRGRVLDARAEPLAGLRIVFGPDARGEHAVAAEAFTARSDRDGRFDMEAPSQSGELVVEDAAYITVMAGLYRLHASIEPVVVAALSRPLAGRVHDVDGSPLSGAHVRLELDNTFGTRFAHVMDASMEKEWSAETDARGSFDLSLAPLIEGARLITSLAGYESDALAAPDGADRGIEIVLRPVEPESNALRGDVRLPDGTPAAYTQIAFGARTMLTDETGRFAFDLAEGDAERVVAVKRGYLPAELAASPSAPRWPDFVRIRLGASPHVLAGRVVDAHGKPLAKVRVWLADPTYFGNADGVLTHVEHLLAGAPTPAEVEQKRAAQTEPYDGPDLFWSFFETDAHGRFRIEGLSPREYHIKAMDPRSLVQTEAGPFTAGDENVEIQLDGGSEFEKVSGRVLARNGEPIAGVRVAAARRVVKVVMDGWSSSRGHGGASTVTDAEGRFELEHVAREGIFLTALGDAILPTWFDFPEKATTSSRSLTDVMIHAVRRCHVQVELGERSTRADAFAVLDAAGERVSLSIIRGENDSTNTVVPLIEGRSPVVALGEDSATLVLLLEDKEVARQPLVLKPGELSVVRP